MKCTRINASLPTLTRVLAERQGGLKRRNGEILVPETDAGDLMAPRRAT
jgi:hypothetical protein